MPRENDKSSRNVFDDLYHKHRVDQQTFSDMWNKLPSAPILNHQTQVPNQPVNGMFVVDPEQPAWCFFLQDRWYCIGPQVPTYAIKIFSDTKATVIRDGAFRWTIPRKYDGWYIINVEAFVGTPGTGPTTLQLSKNGGTIDILSTKVTVPAGEIWSGISGTQPVINQNVNQVFAGTSLWWDIDVAGAGSFGVGAYVDLSREQIVP
jgi:hypothetical protein